MRDNAFDKFQEMNARRCREAFDPELHTVEFFIIAIAGEVGEMANEYKKHMRGDYGSSNLESLPSVVRSKILEEIADIITYCDLLNTKLKANTEIELRRKFDKVSKRRGWTNG